MNPISGQGTPLDLAGVNVNGMTDIIILCMCVPIHYINTNSLCIY